MGETAVRLQDAVERLAAALGVGGPELPGPGGEAGLAVVLESLAHQALEQRRSAEQMRLLVDSVHDYAVYMLDPEGRVTTWNAGAEATKGWSADDVMGRHFRCFFRPEDAGRGEPERALDLARSCGRYEEEVWRIRQDGSMFLAEVVITPVYEPDGRLRGFSNASRDVTERLVRREQALQSQKLEALGELAGGIAHDFNNLLTVMLGYLEILLVEIGPGSPHRSDLEGVNRAAERASALVRQLLTFSRRQVVEPIVFDLDDTLRSLRSMLHRLIGEDIELELRASPRPALVRADPNQMEQVVVNLVVNARDAMPGGGIISIGTAVPAPDPRDDDDGRAMVELTVADTGRGMDEETLRHCFEPFYTTKRLSGGTGLGLATVYGVVSQSEGSVRATSEVGVGTTFTVRLPLAAGRPGLSAGAEPLAGAGGTETILLVEDEDEVRWLARRALTRAGYRVLAARDGLGALALAEAAGAPIDLLVTDLVMPRLGGAELARELRERGRVRGVLFVSGYPERVHPEGPAVPCHQLLTKPFRSDELLERVRQALPA